MCTLLKKTNWQDILYFVPLACLLHQKTKASRVKDFYAKMSLSEIIHNIKQYRNKTLCDIGISRLKMSDVAFNEIKIFHCFPLEYTIENLQGLKSPAAH